MLKSINGKNNFRLKNLVTISLAIFFAILLLLSQSCAGSRVKRINKSIDTVLSGASFQNHHYGILVVDPTTGDTLLKKASNKYFIPASNVKIATLYTSLSLIPAEIPTIRYIVIGDSLYFEGLGNPASLHPKFQDSTLLKFLEKYSCIHFSNANINEPAWAPGWAWEDYDRSFSAERNSLPLFGNVVTVFSTSELRTSPAYFKDSIYQQKSAYYRRPDQNIFYVSTEEPDTISIPFINRPRLSSDLLGSLLNREVNYSKGIPDGHNMNVLYGFSRDSVLRHMMFESDNFLAEQMLLVASSSLSDTLNSTKIIENMKDRLFEKSNELPRWVDGSGLSRYNLFTPESMVEILRRLYSEYQWEYIKNFFPAAGKSGTLKADFTKTQSPFIYAKSGSMGNVYCLSGYLKTSSGRILIFSFLNNNFSNAHGKNIKKEMQQIFELLRTDY